MVALRWRQSGMRLTSFLLRKLLFSFDSISITDQIYGTKHTKALRVIVRGRGVTCGFVCVGLWFYSFTDFIV